MLSLLGSPSELSLSLDVSQFHCKLQIAVVLSFIFQDPPRQKFHEEPWLFSCTNQISIVRVTTRVWCKYESNLTYYNSLMCHQFPFFTFHMKIRERWQNCSLVWLYFTVHKLYKASCGWFLNFYYLFHVQISKENLLISISFFFFQISGTFSV